MLQQPMRPHHQPGPPMGPQSNIVCCGCHTLLAYPQGAQNVRCARCSHITPVPPPAAGPNMAQLVCTNPQCTVVLMYPRGAAQVQCSVCGHVNDAMAANQVGHLICNCCQITLMYAWGAQSVKCAVCNHITPINASTSAGPAPPPNPSGAGPSGTAQGATTAAPGKAVQTVVIENPPHHDAEGNEIQNLAVGVTPLQQEQPR